MKRGGIDSAEKLGSFVSIAVPSRKVYVQFLIYINLCSRHNGNHSDNNDNGHNVNSNSTNKINSNNSNNNNSTINNQNYSKSNNNIIQ